MTSRRVIDILSYADMAGEECLHQVLGDFACPLNEEVEKFLKEKAEQSAKLKSSVTYFVVDTTSGIVLGYFTLVLKPFTIHESKLSKTNIRLISRFAERNDETGSFTVALYMIAQIGKPSTNRAKRDKRMSSSLFMQFLYMAFFYACRLIRVCRSTSTKEICIKRHRLR